MVEIRKQGGERYGRCFCCESRQNIRNIVFKHGATSSYLNLCKSCYDDLKEALGIEMMEEIAETQKEFSAAKKKRPPGALLTPVRNRQHLKGLEPVDDEAKSSASKLIKLFKK